MDNHLFLDDRLVPPDKAKVTPLNTALFFGESLLETIPVYSGKPLFFREHLERLEKGCRFLGWPALPREKFGKVLRLYAARTKGPFAIRFCLAQEPEPPLNPRRFSAKAPRLMAAIRPLRHNPDDFWPSLGRIGVGRWRVPGPEAVPGQFKWVFYMMIRQDFRRHPEWDEMLRLDAEGFVADGGSAAPLWFKDGTLYAPPLKAGGLESVTRGKILSLCRSLGIRTAEKRWKPSDALKGGELFFVGSGVGLLGASHLQGRPLKRWNPLVLRLWQHYRNWAAEKAAF